jgi:plasmid stability protein
MATLTLKSIPDDLYALLKQRAAEHRRSINSEVLVCLEQALRSRRANPEAMLGRVDAVRERLRMPNWTEAALKDAKSSGRP